MKNTSASINWKKSAVGLFMIAAALIGGTTPAMAFDTPIMMDSGVQYFEIKYGQNTAVAPHHTVSVQYTGWLLKSDGSIGKKFDSTYDHGKPFLFTLGQNEAIRGLELGVVGMKVGGKRQLIIPAGLAYGASGAGNGLVPPNANLVFDVELLYIRGADMELLMKQAIK
jgi:FKBP-type peptidyl-prolyl cis-trans isomerase